MTGHPVDLGPGFGFQVGIRLGNYARRVALHEGVKSGVVGRANGSMGGCSSWSGVSGSGLEGFKRGVDEILPA